MYVPCFIFIRRTKALYDSDQRGDGFEWINADDNTRSIFSFVRHSQDGKNNLLFVINFTPVARPDYRVGVREENSTVWSLTAMPQSLAEAEKNSRKYTGQ